MGMGIKNVWVVFALLVALFTLLSLENDVIFAGVFVFMLLCALLIIV